MTQKLLDRFLRYVKMDTQASETSGSYPSSPGQGELAKLLEKELKEIGLADVKRNEHEIVLATLPPTVKHPAPTIAWLAHVDTSPESSGKDVKPVLHKNYQGVDLILPGDPAVVLSPSEFPELAKYKGKTLVTTDGTTLLGGDDKAGIAVIMDAAEYLLQHPEIARGTIRICFTCDEEIGKGTLHLNPKEIGAAAAYTLDSEGSGCIDVETWSADLALVHIHGVNLHPMKAKGKMVNALRLAGEFLEKLPKGMAPETTEGRQGFIHPYVIEGGVDKVLLRILLRDFETDNLKKQAGLLEEIAKGLNQKYPKARVEIEVKKQYRNMKEGLLKEPRAAALAERAMRQAGVTPKKVSIRAGTDGAMLTEKGLPTPNLSCGQHNPHSKKEWVCLEEMEECRNVLIELAKVWGNSPA